MVYKASRETFKKVILKAVNLDDVIAPIFKGMSSERNAPGLFTFTFLMFFSLA